MDVAIKDGKVFLIEISSSVKRGDLTAIKRKKELLEELEKIKIDVLMVLSPLIHDRDPEKFKLIAKALGIEIITPSNITS